MGFIFWSWPNFDSQSLFCHVISGDLKASRMMSGINFPRDDWVNIIFPYIGLIYGRYLQFRWPLITYPIKHQHYACLAKSPFVMVLPTCCHYIPMTSHDRSNSTSQFCWLHPNSWWMLSISPQILWFLRNLPPPRRVRCIRVAWKTRKVLQVTGPQVWNCPPKYEKSLIQFAYLE